MRIKNKSLKFQNWLHLMFFSIIILVVLWLLQFFLLNTFYQNMKVNEIKEVGNKVVKQINNSEDYQEILNEYSFKNNLRIVLLNQPGEIVENYDGFFRSETKSIQIVPKNDQIIFPQSELDKGLEKLEKSNSNSNSVSYLETDSKTQFSQVVFLAKVEIADNSYYLYLTSSIPPIDSTVSVLKTQFIIITIILLVLSLVIANWISKRMAKPIVKLTESAKKVEQGDLNAVFPETGYNEIKELAATLNYATRELRNLDDYRKEIIANVSHDLKTPLTIIKCYAELLEDFSGEDPEKRKEHCEIIIKEADWLTNLVLELLELSKLESSNATVVKEKVNLSEVLAEVLDSFAIFVETENYHFETDIDKDVMVIGSKSMLKRSLYNLISNAINYTGEDRRVIISLKENDDVARFTVTDTGEGIAPEKQEVIWDRYYKSKEVHKRAVIGTGLGLSIVKNVFILHDAKYGLDSKMKEGTTFWFELPIE